MLSFLDEDHAVVLGGLQTGDAAYTDGPVSAETAAEFLGEIAQGLLHGCLLSLSGAGVHNADSFATRRLLLSCARLGRGGAPSPHDNSNLVQRGLAWGAGFPAAVDPE